MVENVLGGRAVALHFSFGASAWVVAIRESESRNTIYEYIYSMKVVRTKAEQNNQEMPASSELTF